MKLVFITYINRSGSTFLTQQLSRYGDVLVCPEADCIARLLLQKPWKKIHLGKAEKAWGEILLTDRKLRHWNLDLQNIPAFKIARRRFDVFIALVEEYRNNWKPQAEIIVFKDDLSIYAFDQLQKCTTAKGLGFKMISLVRDPRAVFASQKATFIESRGVFMNRNPLFLARRWNSHVEKECHLKNHRENFKSMQYEKMILNYDNEMAGLEDFLEIKKEKGISYTGDLAARIPGDQQTMHPNILEPPDKARTEAWKNELATDEIYYLEKNCQVLMEKSGYLLTHPAICKKHYRFWLHHWTIDYIVCKGKHFIWLLLQGFKIGKAHPP